MDKNLLEKNKQDFLTLAKTNIKREGIEELLKWLETRRVWGRKYKLRNHNHCCAFS